jgi:hypothetical protein
MTQALLALLGAALTIAACYALGALLLDRLAAPLKRPERFPLALVLGAAFLHLAYFAVLALQIAYWPVVIGIPTACIAVAIWKGSWRLRGEPMEPLGSSLSLLWGVLFTLFTVVYFFNALQPETSPDGSSYHLGFVARYLRAHGFPAITTNIYASLGQGIELLFMPAFLIGRHSAGALVHFGFLIGVSLAIFSYGRRLGKPWVGAAASLLMYLSPVAGLDGTSAYIDAGVAAIVFSCFYWLEIWEESQNPRFLIPIGILAGYAYAAKYTAFTILPFALLWVLFRSRKLKPVLTVAALSLVMVAPWMIKDWVVVQNPLAPFLNKYFRNPYVHVQFEKEYAENLSRYDVQNKWTLPLEVTIRGGKTTGIIGPVFLLLPLALVALRLRPGRRVVAAAAFVFAPYLLNVGTRFLIPSLPFFSLAICLAVGSAPPLLALLMVFHALASWPSYITRYSSPYVWRISRIPYKEALRLIPQETVLRRSGGYGLARLVESNVPKGERVLAMNGISEAYTSRDVLVGFQGGFNESLADTVNMGWITDFYPSVLRSLKFEPRTTRHVRLTQTGTGVPGEQWNIHELRFLSGGKELARRPEWRMTAFPNPWEIQFAFDNSPATRWRSWEQAFPGMFVDVDFGAPTALDEIHIETSPDFANIKIRTEVSDGSGALVKLGDDFVNSPRPVKANIRRAATWEMHLRGVNYLLMSDTDFGADDMRDDPEAWGLKEIGKGYGARIYQVMPLQPLPPSEDSK